MSLRLLSDQDLVKVYISGDELAFEILLNRHQQNVFSYILNLVKDEELANDLFQDTFIKVIKTLKQGQYNEEGKFLPWVRRIAHNLSIDYFRRNKKMPLMRPDEEFNIFDVLQRDDLNVEQQLVKNQIESDVRRVLNLLPHDQREVVIMRLYGGLSFKEISDITNVSINTSLGRMRYALINLRKMLAEKNISVHV
ncbi:MAG: sigma-70 family RNA polymerase sigma factor [Luteibaculaceae bacterium]